MSLTTTHCIPANPDISGLGVRIAIYIQNILSLVPAVWALRDGKVTLAELEILEKQSVTILLTAFAILISTIAQALTSSGVTSYHVTIILNLSWMNNTNTFIYLLLYIHHKHHQFMRSEEKQSSFRKYLWQQVQEDRHKEIKERGEVVISGSLHLTVMAAVGIWLWSRPDSFGIRGTCSMNASVLFSVVRLSSISYRVWSLFTYSFILLPGLNLIGPAGFFFLLYHAVRWFTRLACKPSAKVPANELLANETSTNDDPTTLSISLGLACVFTIDVYFLALTESQIGFNANLLAPGDSDWTFGQILALLLLVVPLRDLLETILERNSKKLGKILLSLGRSDDDKVAEYLVGLGAPACFEDKSSGDTVILAAKRGRVKMVSVLIKNDDDFDKPRLEAVADAIRESGVCLADPTLSKDAQLLRVAVGLGAGKMVQDLIVDKIENGWIDVADSHGEQLIHLAASNGHDNVIRILLDKGANIEAPNKNSKTPIHLAALNGHAGVVNLLLDAGAKINARDSNGQTPIHLAAANGQDEMVKNLACWGADVNAQDDRNRTPVHLAAGHGHVKAVEALASNGAEIDSPNIRGRRPIHWAATCGRIDVVRFLISKDANIKAQDNNGDTPIHLAAACGHTEVVRCLLEEEAALSALNIKNEGGKLPIDLAREKHHDSVVEILLGRDNSALHQRSLSSV
ncbi:hypothetical protein NP233_g8076 [Leucocoprinus birnbaumii]|uniref:Uncharacterized protein n=1 Tax=Leucocoprinus birnbaumii TaxID=56174 RepID=A0AAD5YU19_9AGAR|nr:hypothetical protein NP233_g8076 [Leucocoprinus birnbaumii]